MHEGAKRFGSDPVSTGRIWSTLSRCGTNMNMCVVVSVGFGRVWSGLGEFGMVLVKVIPVQLVLACFALVMLGLCLASIILGLFGAMLS